MADQSAFFNRLGIQIEDLRSKADKLQIINESLPRELPFGAEYVFVNPTISNEYCDYALNLLVDSRQTSLTVLDLFTPKPLTFSPGMMPFYAPLCKRPGINIQPAIFQVVAPQAEVLGMTNFLMWYHEISRDDDKPLSVMVTAGITRSESTVAHNLPQGQRVVYTAPDNLTSVFVHWEAEIHDWRSQYLGSESEQVALESIDSEWPEVFS